MIFLKYEAGNLHLSVFPDSRSNTSPSAISISIDGLSKKTLFNRLNKVYSLMVDARDIYHDPENSWYSEARRIVDTGEMIYYSDYSDYTAFIIGDSATRVLIIFGHPSRMLHLSLVDLEELLLKLDEGVNGVE